MVIVCGVLTGLNKGAFENCSRLTSITYNGTKGQWEGIKRDYYWKYKSSIRQIICTDGTISV